jgi:hypothetical protein
MFSKYIVNISLVSKILDNIQTEIDLELFIEIHNIMLQNIIDQLYTCKNKFIDNRKANEKVKGWSHDFLIIMADNIICQIDELERSSNRSWI